MASFSYFMQQLLCIVYVVVEGDFPIPGRNRNVIFPLTRGDVLSAVVAITLLLPVVAGVVSRLELKARKGHISARAIPLPSTPALPMHLLFQLYLLVMAFLANGQEVALKHKFISLPLGICFQTLCHSSLPWYLCFL